LCLISTIPKFFDRFSSKKKKRKKKKKERRKGIRRRRIYTFKKIFRKQKYYGGLDVRKRLRHKGDI
jgi:hypothetical protein